MTGAARERPADLLLRRALQAERAFTPEERTLCSKAVFAYFRWKGWMDAGRPVERQLRDGLDLADRFARAPESFPDKELVSRALPSWLADELEITPGLARAMQAEPAVWLRARPGQAQSLAAKLGHCRPLAIAPPPGSPAADALEYRGTEDLFRTPEFHAGEFELQDLSSQAVGWVCSPAPGETWWDACAGEGGKLLHLSDMMRNQGLIWASDRSEWRLKVLRRRAARAKVFNYRAVLWDGGERLPTRTKFDGLLVDAPCSGMGTWQRNPHARWTTTPADVTELAEVQKSLLRRAATALKPPRPPAPGGKLVYAVCTLTRAETLAVVEEFDRSVPGFERIALSDPVLGGQPPGPGVTLRPETHGGNGMFIAAWRRAS